MQAYFLGGDASKGYCDFTILNQDKEVVIENFQLDDTFTGHQELRKVLGEFSHQHPDATLFSGFESTGGYENNWYNLLWQLQAQESFDILVARVNPYGVRHHKEAGLDRIDTDKISAKRIAQYLISYPEKIQYNTEDYFASLKREWKFIRMLKKQNTQLVTHLKSLMYVAHPQLLGYCVEGIGNWVLQVLAKYPTALKLATANVKVLSQIPYVTRERAEELIREAKESVASVSGPNMENVIKTVAHQVLHLRKTIEQQQELMISSNSYAFQNSEMEILISFKGIADYTAFGLLIEIGSIERFPSVKHLASFFGLHPVYRKSGDGTFGMHMSKKGRKEPRWILYNVATSAINSNEMIKQLYNKYVEKKKNKMNALVIIMHKILRIIYGMLKHKKKYDPQVDEANRKKGMKKKDTTKTNIESKENNKSRRYQDYDSNAPISRKQTKKRKQEQKEKEKEGK
jgi:transposase